MLSNRPAALLGTAVLAAALAVTGCAASAATSRAARPARRACPGHTAPHGVQHQQRRA